MAKEALFNILNNHFDFEGIRVLDLFAGTGNISYEFASRGAIEVVAVDLNKRCIDFIRTTARLMPFECLSAIRADAFSYLVNCRTSFDIIFADPPYEMDNIEKVPDLVLGNCLLNEGGWLIIEHSGTENLDGHVAFIEKRKYGKVNFSFFGC